MIKIVWIKQYVWLGLDSDRLIFFDIKFDQFGI